MQIAKVTTFDNDTTQAYFLGRTVLKMPCFSTQFSGLPGPHPGPAVPTDRMCGTLLTWHHRLHGDADPSARSFPSSSRLLALFASCCCFRCFDTLCLLCVGDSDHSRCPHLPCRPPLRQLPHIVLCIPWGSSRALTGSVSPESGIGSSNNMAELFSVKGKVVLVTGGAKGVGWGVRGFRVIHGGPPASELSRLMYRSRTGTCAPVHRASTSPRATRSHSSRPRTTSTRRATRASASRSPPTSRRTMAWRTSLRSSRSARSVRSPSFSLATCPRPSRVLTRVEHSYATLHRQACTSLSTTRAITGVHRKSPSTRNRWQHFFVFPVCVCALMHYATQVRRVPRCSLG